MPIAAAVNNVICLHTHTGLPACSTTCNIHVWGTADDAAATTLYSG